MVSTEDSRLYRRVMSRFPTGVTVVTTVDDGETYAMTANAFMSGSLEPPLCIISIGRSAKMHARLERAGVFGVSFLSESQADLSLHFAGRPLAGVEPVFRRFAGVPLLLGTAGAVAADIVDTSECGDHTLFIGRTKYLQAGNRRPLLFFGGRYARLDEEQRPPHDAPPMSFWWN